jgi:hypothetical protein
MGDQERGWQPVPPQREGRIPTDANANANDHDNAPGWGAASFSERKPACYIPVSQRVRFVVVGVVVGVGVR